MLQVVISKRPYYFLIDVYLRDLFTDYYKFIPTT